MMSDSIATPVRTRNHDGNHFPLRACQVRASEHDGPIKIKVGLQRRRVQAVDSENVGHISFFVVHSAILFRKLGRSFTERTDENEEWSPNPKLLDRAEKQ
jgi:hypothetical protein